MGTLVTDDVCGLDGASRFGPRLFETWALMVFMRALLSMLLTTCLALVAVADGRPVHGTSRRRDAALERCLRHLLEARGLNAYGDAKELMYTGGTPLFDESTGRATPWLDYMKQHHPEFLRSCRSKRR
jgi:hypothetical protein